MLPQDEDRRAFAVISGFQRYAEELEAAVIIHYLRHRVSADMLKYNYAYKGAHLGGGESYTLREGGEPTLCH